MMSVERVLEYRDLEPEKQPETPQKISESWPEAGRIQFRNVFYRYFKEGEPVLRGLSFVIRPKEKIGMHCGKFFKFIRKKNNSRKIDIISDKKLDLKVSLVVLVLGRVH